MASKKRGLGRNNLDALLSDTLGDDLDAMTIAQGEQQAQVADNAQAILAIPLEDLQRGSMQPREHVEDANLDSLSVSIRSEGVLQPILVREMVQSSNGPQGAEQAKRYEIIAGERRFQAAKLAGLKTIPAIVKVVQNEQAMVMALVENVQREDLNPIEEAQALERLLKEHGVTQAKLGELVGKSRAAISNFLRLLTLTDPVKQWLSEGKINLGQAKVLLGLSGEKQTQAANKVIDQGLSVRETETLVHALLDRSAAIDSIQESLIEKPAAYVQDPDIRRLENSISDKLSAKVSIKHKSTGKGKIEVQYYSLEELEGILSHIQ